MKFIEEMYIQSGDFRHQGLLEINLLVHCWSKEAQGHKLHVTYMESKSGSLIYELQKHNSTGDTYI